MTTYVVKIKGAQRERLFSFGALFCFWAFIFGAHGTREVGGATWALGLPTESIRAGAIIPPTRKNNAGYPTLDAFSS